MKSYEIKLEDWQRILFGEVPAVFYLEAAFRIVFIYLLIVFCMRQMGSRMSSNLSRNEMAATIALAAAVGIPVHAPERGLLPAVIVACIVTIGQNYISRKATKSPWFEYKALGHISTLVRDGMLLQQEAVRCRLSQDRIFTEVRAKGLKHLGQVKRLYFEANGTFSIIESKQPKPGLSVIPAIDKEMKARQEETAVQVCSNCGNEKKKMIAVCDNCNHTHFTNAVA